MMLWTYTIFINNLFYWKGKIIYAASTNFRAAVADENWHSGECWTWTRLSLSSDSTSQRTASTRIVGWLKQILSCTNETTTGLQSIFRKTLYENNQLPNCSKVKLHTLLGFKEESLWSYFINKNFIDLLEEVQIKLFCNMAVTSKIV